MTSFFGDTYWIGVPEFFGKTCHIWKLCVFLPQNKIIKEMKKTENKNFFIKLLEDKEAMRECIQNGGDVNKTAEEHGIKLATPL
jgi:hypothetical protein